MLTVEVDCENRSARLVDFRRLEVGRGLRRRTRRLWYGSSKGLDGQVNAFITATGNPALVDRTGYMESSRLIIEINESLQKKLRTQTSG